MNYRILIVEDEETLREALKFNLELEGYEVATAESAEDALELDIAGFDLILLDIMMGAMSGVELAKKIRDDETTKLTPIIFCTAKDGEDDMVAGLDLADDYITKPYSVRNVIARVKSVIRRSSTKAREGDAQGCRYRGLAVDTVSKQCSVDGTPVKMPRKELEILLTLMKNQGVVFSRDDLLSRIWPDEVVVGDRVVDVHITRLRSKIGAYAANIVTRPGYGYVFME